MKRYFILLVLIACSESKISHFDNSNFSFDYPSEWLVNEQSDQQGGFGVVLASYSEYTIVSIRTVNAQYTKEEFMELIIKKLEQDFADQQFEYSSISKGKFGKFETLKLDISGVQDELGLFKGEVHDFREGGQNIMVMLEWGAHMNKPEINSLNLIEKSFRIIN